MPRPKASAYPKEQRWRFLHRSIDDKQLIEFANAIVDSHDKELREALPTLLHFAFPSVSDVDKLYHEWQSIWVNLMHQIGLGYTVTRIRQGRVKETRILATELSRYLADTQNVAAFYYYWALRFQYPFSVPKQDHYINNGVAVQPVVLICQYLDELAKQKNETYLTYFEIVQFLMKSKGHMQSVIKENCSKIIENRKKSYDYSIERENPEFEEAALELARRGHLFIDKFDVLIFQKNRITIDTASLTKLRVFLSYRQPPFIFKENSQDVRNEFFVESYIELDPYPEILYNSVNTNLPKVQLPLKPEDQAIKVAVLPKIRALPIKVENPEDTYATFSSGTRKARKFQWELKRNMLTLYNSRCCVCGLDRQEFLIASHIVAVNIDPSIARDNRNCLLLCVLHDRALENGYFGIMDDYTIVVNREKTLKHQVMLREIVKREGQRISLPSDKENRPMPDFIRRHRVYHGILAPPHSTKQASL